MDGEQPPPRVLYCCTVLAWTKFISSLDTFMLAVSLFGSIIHFNEFPWGSIVEVIINIAFLVLTIKLWIAVSKRDIAFILIWLWTCVIWIILSTISSVIVMFLLKIQKPLFLIYTYEIILRMILMHITKQKELTNTLCIITSMGLKIFLHYPVYQYYNYEKTRVSLPIQGPSRL